MRQPQGSVDRACNSLHEVRSEERHGIVWVDFSSDEAHSVTDYLGEADERLARVLTNDPASGVARHADAGYPEAIETARREGVQIPMADGAPRNETRP